MHLFHSNEDLHKQHTLKICTTRGHPKTKPNWYLRRALGRRKKN